MPTFKDLWFQARREGRRLRALVLMADDTVQLVEIGPRGGWRKISA